MQLHFVFHQVALAEEVLDAAGSAKGAMCGMF